MRGDLFFFIGTEAELIKMFPVIINCSLSNANCHIISSGQNNIGDSEIIKKTNCPPVELILSDESSIKKNALGLVMWWVITYVRAYRKIYSFYPYNTIKDAYMIVHGDTVSTYMGARIGKRLGMKVCHIEAGLRSHNLFSPFPEEIDRLLTSKIADIHFAPGKFAVDNLKKTSGRVINTDQNTLIDSMHYSESVEACAKVKKIINAQVPYFVFVMHRQENLADEELISNSISNLITMAQSITSIVILHALTRRVFIKKHKLQLLEDNPNIIILDRVDYFSFMKLLKYSSYVITDGGSNQEELSYMGKPTLIMRKNTERNEGLGKNAIMYSDADDMLTFSETYSKYRTNITVSKEPSKIIAKELLGNISEQ